MGAASVGSGTGNPSINQSPGGVDCGSIGEDGGFGTGDPLALPAEGEKASKRGSGVGRIRCSKAQA